MPVTTSADALSPSDSPHDPPGSSRGTVDARLAERARRLAPSGRFSDRLLDFADRRRWWIFLFILLLYIAGINGQWRVEPDSGLYLSIGRNLAEGSGYTFHGKDHRLAYPGVPLLFFVVYKAFGVGSFVPHLVVIWLMGLATLGLTYRLFLLHAGRPTAVLLTLGVAVSRIFFRYSFELLTDLPFLLGVMAFLVGYEAVFHRRGLRLTVSTRMGTAPTRWFDGILLILGLAFAVAARPAMWALVGAAALSAVWSLFGKARWVNLIVVGMVAVVVGLFYLQDPRHQTVNANAPVSPSYREEDELFNLDAVKWARYVSVAAHNVPEVLERSIERAGFGTPLLPYLNSVMSVLLLAASISLVRFRPLWAMWVLATLLIVLIVPHPLDRYFLPTVPVFVYAWWRMLRWVETKLPGKWAATTFASLFFLGAVPNMLELFGFIYEQRHPQFLTFYKKGRYATNSDLAKMIESSTPKGTSPKSRDTAWVLVATKFGRAMTLLSRRYCVEPDTSTELDAGAQAVYLLEPSEALHPEIETKHRITPREWMAAHGMRADDKPIATIPNKDPDDPRPWQLFRVLPASGPR